jgi:hypothetical protein
LGWPQIWLLLNAQNRVLGGFCDSEFHDGLGRDFDFLLRFRIDTDTSLSLLLYQLSKAGEHKLAVLFDRFVSKATESIEEKRGGFFVGLGRRSDCNLEFGLGHL